MLAKKAGHFLCVNHNIYIYWSENHMIMWMSSEWLLDQHNNETPDTGPRERIVHFLDLKATYGFYEFLSSSYFPYTMGCCSI